MEEQPEIKAEAEAIGIDSVRAAESSSGEAFTDRAMSRSLDEKVDLIASIAPSAAISFAWSAVEDELASTRIRLAVSVDELPDKSSLQNIRSLQTEGLVDSDTYSVLNKMRQLRNEAVHGLLFRALVSPAEAVEYGRLAQSVIQKLRNLKRA